MGFSLTARQQAADGIIVGACSLHSGDPGTTGANYIAGGGKPTCTWNAADGSAERLLSADKAFTSLGANATVTHFGAWTADGVTFKFGAALTGDQAANAAGEYTLKGTTAKLTA
jgi:hypothetical protein